MDNQLKHSALGISAFVLSLFTFLFIILSGLGASSGGKSSPVAGLLIFMCAIPSTVLAIVDLAKGNSKKLLPIWALILNWSWIILAIIAAIMFMSVYKISTK
jgi:hypothetical protein